MEKVYVVTAGDYSDYHIVGIFSTEQKAAACVRDYNAAERTNGCGNADSTEWQLDDLGELRLYTMYRAWCNLETGEVTEQEQRFHFDEHHKGRGYSDAHLMEMRVEAFSPVSQEHVNKLAVEARQEYLRKYGMPVRPGPLMVAAMSVTSSSTQYRSK